MIIFLLLPDLFKSIGFTAFQNFLLSAIFYFCNGFFLCSVVVINKDLLGILKKLDSGLSLDSGRNLFGHFLNAVWTLSGSSLGAIWAQSGINLDTIWIPFESISVLDVSQYPI